MAPISCTVCKVPAQNVNAVAFRIHRTATYGVYLQIAEVQ